MDPLTIVLALVGIGVGFGANTAVTKKTRYCYRSSKKRTRESQARS